MADIISSDRKLRRRPLGDSAVTPASRAPDSASDNSASLLPIVEMLFFAYRDFTGEADAVLEAYDLGRAHHRVLHFVNRQSGIRVAALLELLKITKQSLGRVLRKLIEDGWIEQAPGPQDRRERRLTLTSKGRDLAAQLARLQTQRIGAALREVQADLGAGTDHDVEEHVRRFLLAMIAREERAAVADIVESGTSSSPKRSKREARE